jgi:hypothetical protein
MTEPTTKRPNRASRAAGKLAQQPPTPRDTTEPDKLSAELNASLAQHAQPTRRRHQVQDQGEGGTETCRAVAGRRRKRHRRRTRRGQRSML